jgi:hypothetical protein
MKATAKRRTAAPAPGVEPRRRREEKPDLARGEVRARPVAPLVGEGPRPVPEDWEPPVLEGRGRWIGGSLRREDMYGDDGR